MLSYKDNASGAEVTDKPPKPRETPSRILLFRPRTHPGIHKHAGPRQQASPRDLTKYESGADADDYRHRMMLNLVAFAVIVVLTAAGIWLAEAMSALRKNQDCALAGRRACAPAELSVGNP